MVLTALVVFVGCSVWTIVYSFTNSRLLPSSKWVGLDQYERLWGTRRWLISIENLAIYGILIFWTIICLFPIYWTITTSFKLAPDVMKGNMVPWWDFTPRWKGWELPSNGSDQ